MPLPEAEVEAAREARRERDRRRLERLRCPRCGRIARPTLVTTTPKKPVPTARSLPSTIVLDVETTGLDPSSDYILTVGICDADGGEVAYFEVCPVAICREWPEAEAVNGISPDDVLPWPLLEDVRPELQRILDAADTVVCYNAAFDLGFLRAEGFSVPAHVEDVMLGFAPIYGEWSDHWDEYRWQRLATCAEYYGAPDFDEHNSLADARGTAWCWSRMREEPAGR